MKTVLEYVLALGGIGMLAVTLASAASSSLSYPAARLMLTNLLRTQPNRAEMMCRAMKHTFAEALAAAMKSGAMLAGVQDLEVIQSATRPTYDGVCQAIEAHWNQLVGKAKVPLLAGAAGLGLAIQSHTMPILLIVLFGALLAAGGIFLLVRKASVERSLVLARADLLPEVDRAFAEGRYALPPR